MCQVLMRKRWASIRRQLCSWVCAVWWWKWRVGGRWSSIEEGERKKKVQFDSEKEAEDRDLWLWRSFWLAHILSCVINKPFLSCCKNHNICFCFHSLYFVALQLWILKHEKGSLCVSHVSPANPHIDWTNPCKKLQCIKGLRCLEVLPKMLSSRKSLARESKP